MDGLRIKGELDYDAAVTLHSKALSGFYDEFKYALG